MFFCIYSSHFFVCLFICCCFDLFLYITFQNVLVGFLMSFCVFFCIHSPPLMNYCVIYKGSVTHIISDTDQTSFRTSCVLRSSFGGIPVVPVMSSVLSALYCALPFQHCTFTAPLFIHNQCGQYRGVLGAVSIL